MSSAEKKTTPLFANEKMEEWRREMEAAGDAIIEYVDTGVELSRRELQTMESVKKFIHVVLDGAKKAKNPVVANFARWLVSDEVDVSVPSGDEITEKEIAEMRDEAVRIVDHVDNWIGAKILAAMKDEAEKTALTKEMQKKDGSIFWACAE